MDPPDCLSVCIMGRSRAKILRPGSATTFWHKLCASSFWYIANNNVPSFRAILLKWSASNMRAIWPVLSIDMTRELWWVSTVKNQFELGWKIWFLVSYQSFWGYIFASNTRKSRRISQIYLADMTTGSSSKKLVTASFGFSTKLAIKTFADRFTNFLILNSIGIIRFAMVFFCWVNFCFIKFFGDCICQVVHVIFNISEFPEKVAFSDQVWFTRFVLEPNLEDFTCWQQLYNENEETFADFWFDEANVQYLTFGDLRTVEIPTWLLRRPSRKNFTL